MSAAALPARRLGTGGPEVSLIGLGCNNFGGRLDLEATTAVLDAALEAGVTLLDTADVYGGKGGSERLMGEVLSEDGRRERVVLLTKFGIDMDGADGTPRHLPRGSRDYVRRALEGSLQRLRTDSIDVYMYHRPDGITPIAETLAALGELVDEGLVAHIACSNVSVEELREADRLARSEGLPRFIAVENEYSLLERGIERDILPAADRLGIGVLPYFPLASGLLSGKYRRGERGPENARLHGREPEHDDERFEVIEGLTALAAEHGVGLVDVAIGTLAAQPAVSSVIAGAMNPEQVRANVAAVSRFQPSEADLRAFDAIAAPGR